MFRIDSPGNLNNQFTQGNPLANPPVPPTVISDIWLTAVQEEIAHFIEASGGTLNKADSGQLWESFINYMKSYIQSQISAIGFPRFSTVVVAASNSTARGKAVADYVCTGASSGNTDDVIIIQAITYVNSLPNGGQVLFLEGTYYLYASIVAESNVSLKGQGVGTRFLRNSPYMTSPILIGSNVSNVIMSDFLIDGNGGTYPCSIGCYGINSSATSNAFRFHNISVQNITTTAAIAAGFYNCNFLFNCLVSSMHGALQGIGFLNCNFLTNCASNNNNTYGYSGCTRMQQNTGTGNTSALFSGCYADANANAAAMTAVGGYNG